MTTIRNLLGRSDFLQEIPQVIRQRGHRYFKQGRVRLNQATSLTLNFIVHGSYEYEVDFIVEEGGVHALCDCPYADGYGICKHIAAALYYIQAHQQEDQTGRWKTQMQRMSELHRVDPRYAQKDRFVLVLSLQKQSSVRYELETYVFPAKHLPPGLVTSDGKSNIEKIAAVLDSQPNLQEHLIEVDGRHTAENCLNPNAQIAFTLLNSITIDYRYSFYEQNRNVEGLLLLDIPLFLGKPDYPLAKRLTFSQDTAIVQLWLTHPEGFLQLQPQIVWRETSYDMNSSNVAMLTISKPHAIIDDHLVPFAADHTAVTLQQLTNGEPLIIPTSEEAQFFDDYFLQLHELVSIRSAENLWVHVTDPEPKKALHLIEDGNTLSVQLMFHYHGFAVPYQSPAQLQSYRPIVDQIETDARYAIIDRNPVWEASIEPTVSNAKHGIKRGRDTGHCALRASVDAVDFLLKFVPKLIDNGWLVVGEELLKQHKINRNTPTLSLNIQSGLDWFDVQALVSFGDATLDWKTLRQALRSKQTHVRLSDDSIGAITPDFLAKLKDLFNFGEQADADGNIFRMQAAQVTLIDQLVMEADAAQVDDLFTERLERLRNFEQIEPRQLSPHFNGELRPYQQKGVDWLYFLHEYDFGGCLADDMGLGKTVQVLAFLQALHHADPKRPPALIVVPRSLMENWKREAAKFTPDLKTHLHTGQGRFKEAAAFDHFDQHQIILVTYGTLARDIAWLREYWFSYVVLDESQAIKNAASQTSKAVRLLTAPHRITMTGTPVENSTLELWAQFSFLNGGLLGSLDYFKKRFSYPIERDKDAEAAAMLRKVVYPFILRRTKEQVAPELPPRTEQIVYNEMLPAQQRFYDRTRNKLREQLLANIGQNGINKSRMQVLTGLLRLRQISNHPQLVNADFQGESSKLNALIDTLLTLREEGHKALVFSQFTKMLALIRAELDVRDVPYLYLDGRTRKRQERVDQFQSDPTIPFFLISLKAGGTGLNLTAADYVIHVDPWWNPAVEMQATDRSHRIGQTKPVFVTKLITSGTVEEKIVKLQERKRTLVEQVISTEDSFFKSLSAEDVDVLFT